MREKYVLKNSVTGIFSMLIYTALNLISKRIFVNNLGDTVMGLNALLSSVLSMLSLMELGIGNAIYFSLYKPLAMENFEQVNAIMNLYAKIYKVIGILILGIGLFLLPFLRLFVKTELPDQTLYVAFVILLVDTVLSYFMSYRTIIFSANQRQYFNTRVYTTATLVITCLQMIAVILTGNYYIFLLIKAILTLVANLYIYYVSGKQYPYLKEKPSYSLPKEFLDVFKKDISALCIIKISSYLVYGTDNILLSTFVDLTAVFIYSNYQGIFSIVNQVFHAVFDSMQASVGNFMVVEGKEKAYGLFENLFFLNFLITSYTSVTFLTLFNDAITIWMGEGYIWPMAIVAVLVFNNYSCYILRITEIFKNAAGIYSPYPAFKYFSLLEGIVNIFASLFFIVICKMGVLGVFLGTSVSNIVKTIVSPYAVCKYYFGQGLIRYMRRYVQYMILTIAYSLASVSLYQLVRTEMAIMNMVLGLVISFAISLGFSVLIFRKTKEYQFIFGIVKKYLEKLRKQG